MRIEIDRMQASDLSDVALLATQLGYPNTSENIEKRFRSVSQETGYALFTARTPEGKVVGWIQINREPLTLLDNPRAEVAALVVDESVRGQGIGTLLLEKAEAWAKAENLKLIRIRSNIVRTDTHRFYERQGYKIKKSWHLFTKEIE